MMDLSIIIPTYNEAENVPILVKEIFATLDTKEIHAEIIIVDDNSPDGTAQVAESLSKEYRVRVIKRAGKLGLGSAVRAGFAASDREYVGVMDADLSHNPSILNELILSLQEYDITMGSRFAEGSTVENWQWWRKALSNVGVFLAQKLSRVKDPLSGYFFLRRSVIAGVSLDTVGYKILLEILMKGNFKKVKEIGYTFRMRQFSSSKLNTKEYWLFLKQLTEYLWYKVWK